MADTLTLYHVTTPKKLSRYRASGCILRPVRGFTTLEAAQHLARRTGRSIILRFTATRPHKLPDHRTPFGEAWWNDGEIDAWAVAWEATDA